MRTFPVPIIFVFLGFPAAFASFFSEIFGSDNHLHQRMPQPKNSHIAKCPPCDQVQCAVRVKRKMKCKGGVASDFCNCCPICAKVEGEHCGGEHSILGTCDKGLSCSKLDLGDEFDRLAPLHGICIKNSVSVAPLDSLTLADEAAHQEKSKELCRPKCTPDFCSKHPRSICSAIDNADESKSCQAACQHTSCMACRFADPEPCPRCERDDFNCMKKYGRCVKRHSCKRKKFPCSKTMKNVTGKFQCLVPDCPL